MGQEVRERFVNLDKTGITQDLHKETGIKQMEDGMFNAADILVHAHPMIDRFMAEGCLIVMGIGVTQIVPARADEGIHRIQFTRCRAAAFRAGAVHEGFARSKRALGAGRKLDICRQFYRQILFRDEDFAALRAIDDRNGCAPIALTLISQSRRR